MTTDQTPTEYHIRHYAQTVHRFPNGYGASVVRGDRTYGGTSGLFELAVLDRSGELTYSTPVTGDVLSWLTYRDVADALDAIAALPPAP